MSIEILTKLDEIIGLLRKLERSGKPMTAPSYAPPQRHAETTADITIPQGLLVINCLFNGIMDSVNEVSAWEHDFITSIQERNQKSLSPAQLRKVGELHEKYKAFLTDSNSFFGPDSAKESIDSRQTHIFKEPTPFDPTQADTHDDNVPF